MTKCLHNQNHGDWRTSVFIIYCKDEISDYILQCTILDILNTKESIDINGKYFSVLFSDAFQKYRLMRKF
jgi:hypothetical protein